MQGNRRERLTDALVRRLPLTSTGQYAVRDTELVGFMVMVGKTARTFMIQLKVGGQNIKQAVGRAGDLPVAEARVQAAKMIADLRTGTTRHTGRSRGVTLGQAWEDYRDSHLLKRGRSAGTIANYRDHMERLFARWLDTPLAELAASPKLVRDRHAQITRENGPYIANGSARSLRAVYNWARRKIDRTLPADPPIDASDFNDEERRDTAMSEKELAAWNNQLAALPNALRREFHLFTLLSGSRPAALSRARWEHLDLERRALRFPDPKGGLKKAFDMPLSREMLRCLWRARRAGRKIDEAAARTFIFPALSASGHLEEWKEDRDDLSKWGSDLRQTYATMAQAVGVPLFFIKVLMNHTNGGDVTLGYVTIDALRAQVHAYQQAVSTRIRTALDAPAPEQRDKVEAAARRAGYTSREGVAYDEATDTVSDAMQWEVENEN